MTDQPSQDAQYWVDQAEGATRPGNAYFIPEKFVNNGGTPDQSQWLWVARVANRGAAMITPSMNPYLKVQIDFRDTNST